MSFSRLKAKLSDLKLLMIEEIDEHLDDMAEALIRLIKPLHVDTLKIVILFSNLSSTGRLFAEALVSGADMMEGIGLSHTLSTFHIYKYRYTYECINIL